MMMLVRDSDCIDSTRSPYKEPTLTLTLTLTTTMDDDA
jgi:hypothetical protein